MLAPKRVDSTSSTLSISWQQPSDDGGCPLKSYAVFRDDAIGSSITMEANADKDTNVRDKPTLD